MRAGTNSNATGTNFTVQDIGTAFQVAGGSGTDTLTAQGFVFSADQRNAIFAASSIEKIVDQAGTYTVNAPPIITSNGGGDAAAVSIAENTTAVTTVTATDPDPGFLQTLSYPIIGGRTRANSKSALRQGHYRSLPRRTLNCRPTQAATMSRT
jgi:hypothetical protein